MLLRKKHRDSQVVRQLKCRNGFVTPKGLVFSSGKKPYWEIKSPPQTHFIQDFGLKNS